MIRFSLVTIALVAVALGSIAGAQTPMCFGDGTGHACPCSNTGAAGYGCANSDHPGGAILTSTGTASLSADTLTLTSTGHHLSTLARVYQGVELTTPVFWGDGIRCIGSVIQIFHFTPANTVTLTAPSASSIPPSPATISGQGGPLVPGNVRCYQLVYRDPAFFCTFWPYNSTNGIRVVWAP